MATIRPFRAYRPAPGLEDKIAALPYDVVNTEEAAAIAHADPYTFLRVDRAEIDLAPGTDPHDELVYKKAKENLDRMITEEQFIRDDKPCFYIYRLIRDGKAQTGLAATVSTQEYESGIIKKHELTRADKERDRINHISATGAHTGPIFITYRRDESIESIINGIAENDPPIYDFTCEDGVTHTMWKIDDGDTISLLTGAFGQIPNLYIADGHHRNAAAAAIADQRKLENPAHTGSEGYNFYLAVLFPDDELTVLDYNRVVKDLAGMSETEFLTEVKTQFEVENVTDMYDAKPKAPSRFGMYLSGRWYMLRPLEPLSDDPVKSLDVSVLQDRLLSPILKIGDPRTDARIDFIGGIRGLSELEKRVDSGDAAVAFAMYPTSVSQLMNIADENEIMPPKSTWFEPKLRSGLLIHMLDD